MRVTTFGECLFRLSTHKGERLSHAQSLNFYLGGTELNIAANLSSLGMNSQWVSLIAEGMTGELIKERISALKVGMEHCQDLKGGKPGWYLVESGAAPRPDTVLNRYASSLADQKEFGFEWKKILQGSKVFHTSGVTAGLSTALTQEVKKAMLEARSQNVLVSYDFNYRKNIWSIEEFVQRQKDLLPLIDILFCAESDLELFFKKDPSSLDYSSIFKSSSLKYLVINQRSSDENEYGIKIVTPDESFMGKKYQVQNLDRIGVGDSMAAGFLAALLSDKPLSEVAQWASLAGALKYGIKGDMALLKEKEILQWQNGSRGIVR